VIVIVIALGLLLADASAQHLHEPDLPYSLRLMRSAAFGTDNVAFGPLGVDALVRPIGPKKRRQYAAFAFP
jgi:hypothetical protein